MQTPRRVIAGLDSAGRSSICIDGPASTVIWSTAAEPADNSGTADAGGGSFRFPTAGTQFIYSDFAPGFASPWHTTNTIDYIVIVAGEAVFVTDAGEARLQAGDVVVDRGVRHAWRNDGKETCRMFSVLCPAHPVGAGATMSGDVGQLRSRLD